MYRQLVLVFCLLTILMPGVVGTALAQDGGTKQIGLVVAFPDGTNHLEIVSVPEAATTFEALESAAVELAGQETQFGPAVCNINGTGCPADNCFCDPQRFWAYFHLDESANAWVAAQEGAGVYVPADGAVEGFAWSESDANFNAVTQPPVYSFEQLRAESGGGTSQAWIWVGAAALLLVVAAIAILRRRPAER